MEDKLQEENAHLERLGGSWGGGREGGWWLTDADRCALEPCPLGWAQGLTAGSGRG